MEKMVTRLHDLKDAKSKKRGHFLIPKKPVMDSTGTDWLDLPLFLMQGDLTEDLQREEFRVLYVEPKEETRLKTPYAKFLVEFDIRKLTKASDPDNLNGMNRCITYVEKSNEWIICVPYMQVIGEYFDNTWVGGSGAYFFNSENLQARVTVSDFSGEPEDPENPKKELIEHIEATCILSGMVMTLLCLMLKKKTDIIDEAVEAPKKLNKARSAKGKATIPAYRSITLKLPQKVDYGLGEGGGEGTGMGSPKTPHWRREHTRRLRNGREITIGPMRIKGGGDAPPQYNIILNDV